MSTALQKQVPQAQLAAGEQIFNIDATFGVKLSPNAAIKGRAQACPFTPALVEPFAFEKRVLMKMLTAKKLGSPLRLFGPSGCGKSEHVLQFAARLNLPVQVVQGNEETTIDDLIGSYVITPDKSMAWVDGPVTMAARYGHILLIEEEDMIRPGVKAFLNGILGGKPLVLAANNGEVVPLSQGFWVVATGNTGSAGDVSGDWQGARRHNKATLNRYLHCRMDYPAPEVEVALLTEANPNQPVELVEKLVLLANKIRALYKEGRIADPITTRQLMKLGSASEVLMNFDGAEFEEAFRMVHFDVISEEDRQSVAGQYELVIGAKIDPSDAYFSHEDEHG